MNVIFNEFSRTSVGQGASSRRRFACRASVRGGITLLEILVSIFILSVGLLGVAALIPVGNSEVTKASVAHRGAETGQRAFREMKLRGYLNPENWLSGGSAVVNSETGVMRPEFAGASFMIDPLTAATSGGQATIPGTRLKALSLRSALATESNKTAPQMQESVAERIFVGQDNLLFDRPKDKSLAPTAFKDGGTGSRRRSNPLYSWAAMLVPMQVLPNGNLAPEFKLDTYLMSVIVFYRDLPGAEPRKSITMSAQPLGGTEFRFQAGQGASPEDSRKFLRPRRWVLLTDGDKLYRWYRVGTVEGSVAEDRTDRVVSLIGPDWDQKATRPPTAILYEGVVNVMEKMVQLESQTMWSPGATPTTGRKK